MPDHLFEPGPLGGTGLRVTPVCVGTSPLAGMPEVFGYDVDADRAEATIEAALAGPVNFLDTSNNYGAGRAEERIGAVLRRRGGLPAGFVLATKVDADPGTGEFGADRVRKSVEESLGRLGLDRVPLLYLHDPEYYLSFDEAMARGGPVEALAGLRDDGIADHIGIACGPVGLGRQFIATGAFDTVLSHNRYTLVDRSALPLIQDAAERGVGFVNAAVYGGGMLARGLGAHPRYAYRPAPRPLRDAVGAMGRVCAAYGVELPAAALQFSVRDRRVGSTVVGMSAPARVAETVRLATMDIPADLWAELDALAPPADGWLG